MPRHLYVPDFEDDTRQTEYLARLWFDPGDPARAWAVDDWVFDGASTVSSVTEALAWAVAQEASAFELFCRTSDEHEWIRLHGTPPDGVETVIEIPLTLVDSDEAP